MLQPEAQLNYQRGRKAPASDTTGLVDSWAFTEGTGDAAASTGSEASELARTGVTWVEGLMDRSTNATPLTSFGSPTWSNQGRTITGTQNIRLSSIAQFPTGVASISIVGWVKPSDATGLKEIFFAGAWGLEISNATVYGFTNGGARATTGNVIVGNAWSFIAFTQDTTTGNATYFNNSAPVTDAYHTTLGVTSTGYIGNVSVGSRPIKGVEGEVWIYNRVLTAQEILQIYNSTKFRYGL
jgi:hypothetical protein